GTHAEDWHANVSWTCRTGNPQMAIIWLKPFGLTGRDEYQQAARDATLYVKQHHRRDARNAGIAGGVAGSFPIYRDYHPYLYVNWGAKFFVDALLFAETRVNSTVGVH